MFIWLRKLWRYPREIGAVSPSSPSLARLMVMDIKPTDRVLEMGPGTGVLTKALVAKLNAPHQLTLVEFDSDLAKICEKQYPGVRVVCEDIETFLTRETTEYDAMVSGVPFGCMIEDKRKRVFSIIRERIKTGGLFVLFQYSLIRKKEVISIFGPITQRFTPWNIPPAFVFTAKK